MDSQVPTGILLVNTGTPDAPTREAVVRYLRNFLTDRRIVNIPPLIWKPVLNGIILRVRPEKTVRIYQRIWTSEGSPYTLHSQALEQALAEAYRTRGADNITVRMAHRYGNPSMEAGLRNFKMQGCTRLIVLPLYPQQAFPTTHSVHDELTRLLSALSYQPELNFIWDYCDDPTWIQAVVDSIRPHLPADPSRSHLLFSFHSEPLKDRRAGDPYCRQVEQSVQSIGEALGLPEGSFSCAFQSQFDDAQRWLGPFLHHRAAHLKSQGIDELRVVCPGFAVDCTETLYDIEVQLRLELAGDFPQEHFSYIPCLNASPTHVKALMTIIEKHL
ncbi:MAG: ferrochelatase [Coriobacteriales bacterium]|jgi:ferrochelatase|nr:ferrochelatase [Coriobacteriales bacterium]